MSSERYRLDVMAFPGVGKSGTTSQVTWRQGRTLKGVSPASVEEEKDRAGQCRGKDNRNPGGGVGCARRATDRRGGSGRWQKGASTVHRHHMEEPSPGLMNLTLILEEKEPLELLEKERHASI